MYLVVVAVAVVVAVVGAVVAGVVAVVVFVVPVLVVKQGGNSAQPCWALFPPLSDGPLILNLCPDGLSFSQHCPGLSFLDCPVENLVASAGISWWAP